MDEYREMLKKIQEVCKKNDDCNECPIRNLCSFCPSYWTESDIDRCAEALADG